MTTTAQDPEGRWRGCREISEQQARQVLKILVEECGHLVIDPRDGDAFVWSVALTNLPAREYRLNSKLGFGGKFRNNGNHDNTPYVDCYHEDETPARLQMIEKANARLKELFNAR